ncbi:hypothetical protein DERP_003978 [Dermatophagoides pteronyssinus]|uniref:Uncharacterized protein n=1 Tax=Dermatophagoides pteronyssinus TaxID=6956 RepID=A0ABQ8J7X0_DERPT|nr:hypothetical protein DERP_003978 [Dermatophagoides pteronyssinus]
MLEAGNVINRRPSNGDNVHSIDEDDDDDAAIEVPDDDGRRYLPLASTQTVYHFSETRSRSSALRAPEFNCKPAGDVNDLSDKNKINLNNLPANIIDCNRTSMDSKIVSLICLDDKCPNDSIREIRLNDMSNVCKCFPKSLANNGSSVNELCDIFNDSRLIKPINRSCGRLSNLFTERSNTINRDNERNVDGEIIIRQLFANDKCFKRGRLSNTFDDNDRRTFPDRSRYCN